MSVPHFNYIHIVLQALVPAAAGFDDRMRQDACSALSTLLSSGRNADVMLDAVQLVADLVRQRKCVCSADIVRALLVLQFKDLTKADVEKGAPLECAAAWGSCRACRTLALLRHGHIVPPRCLDFILSSYRSQQCSTSSRRSRLSCFALNSDLTPNVDVQ